MAQYRKAVGAEAAFMDELLEAGLFVASGVPGIVGRSERFEQICDGLNSVITAVGAPDEPEQLRFPPVLPRHQLEAVGYLSSFPHLAGSIFSFEGQEEEAREQEGRASRHEDWSEHQRMTDLVLLPAACYPVYPAISARGPVVAGGYTIDAGAAYVYRCEPAGDPARLQMFRQRERVRIGEPDSVLAWRDLWRGRAVELLQRLGLRAHLEVANDPFFGRAGRMLSANQRAQELKYEVTVPIASPENTAVASFNYHQEHFSHVFEMEMADGGPVHTACLGFGVERIALGLLREHGLDPAAWPSEVVAELWS